MRCRFSAVPALFCELVVVVFLLTVTGATEFQLQSRCRRVVKQHTRLAEGGLQATSRVIRSEYPVGTASQCYALCCNYIADDGSRCNAAVYESDENDQLGLLAGGTCLLLDCGPTFKGCLWQSGLSIQSSVAHVIHKRTIQKTNVNNSTTSNTTSTTAAGIMSAPTSATAPLLIDTTTTTSGDQTTATIKISESTEEQKQLMFPTLPTTPNSVEANVTTTASTSPSTSPSPSPSPHAKESKTDYSDYDDDDPVFFDDEYDEEEQLQESKFTTTDATTTTSGTTTKGSKKFDDLWDVAKALDELQRQRPTASKGSLVTVVPTTTKNLDEVDPFFQPDQLPMIKDTSSPVNVPVLSDVKAADDWSPAARSTMSPNNLERHDDVNMADESHADNVMKSADIQSTAKSGIVDIEGNLNNPWDRNDDRVKIEAIFVPDKATSDDAPADDFQSPAIVLAIVSTMTLIGIAIGLLLVICRRLTGASKTRYMPLREDVFGADSGRPEFPTNYLVASSRQSARLLPK